jgi:predicted phosphoribosyltransferase
LFHAVGAHYRDFRQVEDAQVAALLKPFATAALQA